MTIELFDAQKTYTAPTGAQLTYYGGKLLDNVTLVGVFVDDFPFAKEMSAYLDWYTTSDLLTELQEYNVSGTGTHLTDVPLPLFGSVPTPTPPPPPVPTNCPPGCAPANQIGIPHLMQIMRHKKRVAKGGHLVTDSDLQYFLAQSIGNKLLPPPTASMLYVVFLPDGVSVQMGGDESCVVFCGYHNAFMSTDGEIYYAMLPFPSCSGCLGGLSALDALTSVTSHEISEAITDAVPGTGWYDNTNGEIGDICAWQQRQDGIYLVQREWSNAQNACI